MSFTHTIEQSITTSGEKTAAKFSRTEDYEQKLDKTVAPSVTDGPITGFDFVVAKLRSIFIVSDQDVILETNSPSAPSNTINLKANVPLFWQSTTPYFANPFTVDVTSLYFTTGAIAAAANINARALVDPV